MQLEYDITATDGAHFVGQTLYTKNLGTGGIRKHSIVAVYAPSERSGYGIRLVNQDGIRLNPSKGIYTNIGDLAAEAIESQQALVDQATAKVEHYEDRLAQAKANLAEVQGTLLELQDELQTEAV